MQAEIGEALGVSQPPVSRAVAALTPILVEVVADYVPVAEDLDPRTQYIVDGSLLPCWSWRGHREPYSGKHKTTGMNVQVVCDLTGQPALPEVGQVLRHRSQLTTSIYAKVDENALRVLARR